MIRNKYKLSNIARSSIKNNNKKYRVIYYPSFSVIDSVIGSIPELIIFSEKDVPAIGFDIILSYNDISSKIIDKSIKYHRPIININTSNKKIDIDENSNIHIMDISEDKIKKLFPESSNTIDIRENKNSLLYIKDADPGISGMVNNFLSSKKILFETINPEDFILININNLINIFSKYTTILTNTNNIDLYLAYLSGANPITFNASIHRSEFSTYTTEEDFDKIIQTKNHKIPENNKPYTTNDLDLFNKNILEKIKEISNRQFIL